MIPKFNHVIVEFDSEVPTEQSPQGEALWWLAINVGTDKEGYTSFTCRPTKRQIRQFRKKVKKSTNKRMD